MYSYNGRLYCINNIYCIIPGERMMEESYATLSWNQPPAKFKAERRFRGRCIGSIGGVFGFNRYTLTRPRRVLFFLITRKKKRKKVILT